MKNIKPKIVAIVGPTASGKTAIGVKLAKKFNGEIVSADSRQIFRGLDLGTGKDLSEYGDIKYHLIDICESEEEFNLFKYTELAKTAMEDILSRGKLPIIVGGTGLYVQALTEGFQLKKHETRNKKQTNSKSQSASWRTNYKRHSREELEDFSIKELQKILKDTDNEVFKKLSDKKNPHRLIRAIERAQSGLKMTKVKPDWDFLQIAINLPRETSNKRIDKRVEVRFEQGMLKEVQGLLKSGVDPSWLLKLGLEYRIIGNYVLSRHSRLDRESRLDPRVISLGEAEPRRKPEDDSKKNAQDKKEFELMKETLKLRSHQYAKRQVTWFKRFPEIIWFSDYKEIEKRVQDYL